jgi:hypothetical protein
MAGTGGGALRRFWDALPIDGRGFVPPGDPDARWLIRFTTRRRFAAVPALLLPLVIVPARLIWCVKAAVRMRRGARGLGIGFGESLRMLGDACLYGLHPRGSRLWRGPLGAVPRPLSSFAVSKFMSELGDPEQRRLLVDKQAVASMLEARGIATPRLLAVIPKGASAPELPDAPDMFVKPQSGSHGRDAFRVVRVAPDRWRIGDAIHDRAQLTKRLARTAARDALLVQQCLRSAPELEDLAMEGMPPFLRIVIAREPGGEPFLHSVLFSIRVPGEAGSDPLRSLMRVAVSLPEGRLLPAYWLGQPDARYEKAPWGDVPIAGRQLPGFDAAVSAALAATEPLDRLPHVGWDVILSDSGPVILEGDTHTDWLLISLAAQGAPDAVPWLPLLRRWAEA